MGRVITVCQKEALDEGKDAYIVGIDNSIVTEEIPS